jgi:hypothetical protein
MKLPNKLQLAALLTTISMTLSTAAVAEAISPVLDDKFTFKLGAMYNEIDGTVTINKAPLPETPVDIDDILGIDTSQTSPWLGFRWRFGERWALNFHFDRFDQSGDAAVLEEFNLDGVVYEVGARIETDFRSDAYVMDVSYSIWQGDNYEAGIGLGLHAFDLEIEAKGTVLVGDFVDEFSSTSETLLAPVPNLRLYGTYAFNAKTSVSLTGGWLSLTYEDFEGDYYYVESHVDYRFTESWGAGIGAQYTDIDVEHDSGGGDFENLNVNFTGVQAYITYSF